MHHKAIWGLTKTANRGFRGYPVATIAFYGPDDRRASKVAVAIVPREGMAPTELERWRSDDHDVRDDVEIAAAISPDGDRLRTEVLNRLTLVVPAAAEGNVRQGGRTAPGHGLKVVQLEQSRLAASSFHADERAAPHVALPDRADDGGRHVRPVQGR